VSDNLPIATLCYTKAMSKHHHNSGHGTRRRHQELLYDPDVPRPSHAERARTLVERAATGTLCTLSVEPDGYPYGSFVTFGLWQGQPVLLISALAEHTKNLLKEARCSLLTVEAGTGDPLARGRVTLVGQCAQADDEQRDGAREAFLGAHPNASFYADFKDFRFWLLTVESIRYIGGYGRMSWVEPEHWSQAQPCPVAARSETIIDHMNDDHAETLALYCRAFSKATETKQARMTAVDRYGFEMSAQTEQGPRPIRLGFSEPITDADQVRKELVALARSARDKLGLVKPAAGH